MGLKRRLDHFLPQVRFGQVNVMECRFLFLAISPDRPLINNPVSSFRFCGRLVHGQQVASARRMSGLRLFLYRRI